MVSDLGRAPTFKGAVYLDQYSDVNKKHTELQFVLIWIWEKQIYKVLLWTFIYKLHIRFAGNIALCFKPHSVVKSYIVLL